MVESEETSVPQASWRIMTKKEKEVFLWLTGDWIKDDFAWDDAGGIKADVWFRAQDNFWIDYTLDQAFAVATHE